MEFLYNVSVDPFLQIFEDPVFFIQVIAEGLMAGVMYSLVALGFCLIYKASGVFNFAQGIFIVFSVLCLITVFEFGVPIIPAVIIAFLAMVLLSYIIERVMLRHLVNQEEIIMFMATIGLAFFLEGFGQTIFGGGSKLVPTEALHIGRDPIIIPMFDSNIRIQQLDLTAGVIAALLVGLLALFFQKTPVGRALRAVADDHQAALSIGIPLQWMWVVVWSVAGLVALVAGIMWGASSSVDFSLVLIALKALPVLILGGFTSVPGVIVGGLIIGVGEKIAEIYWGDALGGSIEEWFAYVLALVFLMFRPQGLFGEKIIERV
ncbi:MAG: branched-chain amino acid ABC transporter permease [Rhodospirillaceae bacterium]|nr:branched-chain amino acid ABC transporter permease [Rhodospirillaceae bacterium]|tara:strand:+ start:3464 stop:4420 length:957 start_codon:yes stop_codon:yes gene_type:complete